MLTNKTKQNKVILGLRIDYKIFWVLEIVGVLLLFTIFGAVYFSTIFPDQSWGGDNAQYIQQAINITQGKAMTDTGYIYSRYSPVIGPRAYPPGFPLLLAPVYALFGLNIVAFQIEIIVLQLLALVVIYLLYRREVSIPAALILLLMMGLSPYLISFKRTIYSDVPFMLAGLSFLLYIEYVSEKQKFTVRSMLFAALLAFACYLIRTVGFVALMALLASDLIKLKRPTRFSMGTLGITVLLVVISRFMMGGGEESYFDQLANYSPMIIVNGMEHYLIHSIRGFWAGPSLSIGPYIFPILWLVAIPLIVYGFLVRAKRSNLFIELFFLFNLSIILAWPSVQELRFLYPILPLLLLYAGIGFEQLLRQIGKHTELRVARALAVATVIGIIIIYSVRTTKVVASEAPVTDGPYMSESVELFDFVRKNTHPDDVFIFFKPRVLSLYTQRKASAYPFNQPKSVVIDYLKEIDANYVIVKNYKRGESNRVLENFVKTCSMSFQPIFNNDEFEVYLLDHTILDACTK